MSLDISFIQGGEEVFEINITHNLGQMAQAAGIYYTLWRPEELGFTTAQQMIPSLSKGLILLQMNREEYEQYNALNGWGTYKHFVPFVEKVLEACRKFPEARIEVSR